VTRIGKRDPRFLQPQLEHAFAERELGILQKLLDVARGQTEPRADDLRGESRIGEILLDRRDNFTRTRRAQPTRARQFRRVSSRT
jgi:hypothetical protein